MNGNSQAFVVLGVCALQVGGGLSVRAAAREPTCHVRQEQAHLDPDRDAAPMAEDASQEERTNRLRRAQKYNNPGAKPLEPAGPITPDTFYLGETDEIPELPLRESDAIVVGTIVAFQPYFSPDRTFIYTDFMVCIDTVLKGGGRRSETVTVERSGGAIHLGADRVVSVASLDGERAPRVGVRYVLFLRKQRGSPVFTMLRIHALRAGRVHSMYQRRRQSPFDGMAEATFLRQIGAGGHVGEVPSVPDQRGRFSRYAFEDGSTPQRWAALWPSRTLSGGAMRKEPACW